MPLSNAQTPPDDLADRQAELASLIRRFSPGFGIHETAIGPLNFIRSDTPTDSLQQIHKPALCVLAQGRKEVSLRGESYTYDALHYLVVSVTLPISGRVIEATPDQPYLCARLDIDPAQITQLIADKAPIGVPAEVPGRGLFVERTDTGLLDALLRLVRLLDDPASIDVLAPMALREIYYRLLRGQQGQRLYEIAVVDSHAHRVTRAIEWLNYNFKESLRMEELAQRVNLGVSTLHHRFKAMTAMSPLQYQKQLRLQEARRLMLAEHLDVGSAAFEVGYESPSQFSREYSRQFGASPLKDVTRLRSIA
ncbi:AraC family transcriptional regulator N-terminal domain-containing protein [Pseudomonas sp. NPDC089554]|uniref:AraC family transcriptional regulator n=1 Tax=Pseudomonas sp. NPDC089554 TaxID=3390653 RepID=UPI003D02E46E